MGNRFCGSSCSWTGWSYVRSSETAVDSYLTFADYILNFVTRLRSIMRYAIWWWCSSTGFHRIVPIVLIAEVVPGVVTPFVVEFDRDGSAVVDLGKGCVDLVGSMVSGRKSLQLVIIRWKPVARMTYWYLKPLMRLTRQIGDRFRFRNCYNVRDFANKVNQELAVAKNSTKRPVNMTVDKIDILLVEKGSTIYELTSNRVLFVSHRFCVS